jgi:hypothetical protein
MTSQHQQSAVPMCFGPTGSEAGHVCNDAVSMMRHEHKALLWKTSEEKAEGKCGLISSVMTVANL